jgi:hypothetical protein
VHRKKIIEIFRWDYSFFSMEHSIFKISSFDLPLFWL